MGLMPESVLQSFASLCSQSIFLMRVLLLLHIFRECDKVLEIQEPILYSRGHQTCSWRAGVLQSLAPTLIKHTWTS